MKVLLVGVGGVGEATAAIAKPRAWMEQWCLPITTSSVPGKCRRSSTEQAL
ncbi:MAG: hypothetical protein IPL17_16780, partial [Anaerolineales bacterium]|nr:hypothetical protein [Anaerolineales bacterium]